MNESRLWGALHEGLRKKTGRRGEMFTKHGNQEKKFREISCIRRFFATLACVLRSFLLNRFLFACSFWFFFQTIFRAMQISSRISSPAIPLSSCYKPSHSTKVSCAFAHSSLHMDIPFFFGSEETEQVEQSIKKYQEFFRVKVQKPKYSRAPTVCPISFSFVAPFFFVSRWVLCLSRMICFLCAFLYFLCFSSLICFAFFSSI